jgi:hypothetical protein
MQMALLLPGPFQQPSVAFTTEIVTCCFTNFLHSSATTAVELLEFKIVIGPLLNCCKTSSQWSI